MNLTKPMSAGGLYYPYIHVRDINWLRANLIIFPCVKRMVPMNFTPQDDPRVRELTEYFHDKPPLLQPANLWSERSTEAQAVLARKLEVDSQNEAFLRRYGLEAARSERRNKFGFQIHVAKLSDQLRIALTAGSRLAWKPDVLEPNDGEGYVEVHPRVGEAVMSTLAVACAQAEGLDIVGDERTGRLRRCLVEKDARSIYETWLDLNSEMDDPLPASGEQLMEFILGIPGDLSSLSVEKLHQIASEREPIDKLINALREHASKIPAMDYGVARDQAFKQAATKSLESWESDRRNFSRFVREFFTLDAANQVSKFASTVADKTLTGLVAGTATTAVTAASGGWVGTLAAGGVIGAGAGLVIGLLTHGGTAYARVKKGERESPYRFLTTLEDAGVVFRSEAKS